MESGCAINQLEADDYLPFELYVQLLLCMSWMLHVPFMFGWGVCVRVLADVRVCRMCAFIIIVIIIIIISIIIIIPAVQKSLGKQ